MGHCAQGSPSCRAHSSQHLCPSSCPKTGGLRKVGGRGDAPTHCQGGGSLPHRVGLRGLLQSARQARTPLPPSSGASLLYLVNNYFGHLGLELQVGEGTWLLLTPFSLHLGLPAPSFTPTGTHTSPGAGGAERSERPLEGEPGGRLGPRRGRRAEGGRPCLQSPALTRLAGVLSQLTLGGLVRPPGPMTQGAPGAVGWQVLPGRKAPAPQPGPLLHPTPQVSAGNGGGNLSYTIPAATSANL